MKVDIFYLIMRIKKKNRLTKIKWIPHSIRDKIGYNVSDFACIDWLSAGPANGEVMMDTFVAYREPGIKELTDTTFEHLTQVSQITAALDNR